MTSPPPPATSADVLIVGSGAAGLTAALTLADRFRVTVLAKGALNEGSTAWAQGGIAAVLEPATRSRTTSDDTMVAGAGLNDRDVVEYRDRRRAHRDRATGPARRSVPETEGHALHLTREGGHSHRRIVHVADATGWAVQEALLNAPPQRIPTSRCCPTGSRSTLRPAATRSATRARAGCGASMRSTARRAAVELHTAQRDHHGHRRRRADLSVLHRASRRDRRRHRHGVARGLRASRTWR